MFSKLQAKFKAYVQQKMEGYVVAYFAAHPEVKLVIVAGSVGKTSTKHAISTMLSQRYRVRMHEGNHNTEMSAPLAILGIPYPDNVKSWGAWREVFRAAEARILQAPDVDVIVQELGADHPGDIARFGRYLHPDIAIITAITPEHMEYFQTMEAVAQEELVAANFSKLAIINRDDIEGRFASYLTNTNVTTYGTSEPAEYRFLLESFDLRTGFSGAFVAPESPQPLAATIRVVGQHNIRPAVGAAAVALKLGLSPQEVANGFAHIQAVPGRMHLIDGARGSVILDDTYNSSPVAAVAAIETFLSLEAPQRIAILGSMNELGQSSQAEHEKLGRMFDPDSTDWVITIGEEAEQYLAPAARSRGCQVKSFRNAVQAGAFAKSVMQEGALVLAKGSQGDVYAEEAVKVLLRNPDDYAKLVRQSPAWLAHKEDFFAKHL